MLKFPVLKNEKNPHVIDNRIPPQEDKGKLIRISIIDNTGEQIFFSIITNIPMGNLFGFYAVRKGVERQYLRFRFNCRILGNRILPKEIELDDGSVIFVEDHSDVQT
ncbi:MAG: hypothetical protein EZS28_023570 [Streblomastix strix]|uniref:Ubiquitin-like domain-containing protein n=1 Tax=Streblomastix strix TaxID=222440 RepID=A0A5J4VEE2_9EUKA|nr:MAG: hypothetical protein EZS28_023570 [Streblomastix strix]